MLWVRWTTVSLIVGNFAAGPQFAGGLPPFPNKDISVKAVVMAGGEGSRLRPLTIGRPKPMVPVVNKAVIGHIFDLLKAHGITEVVVTLRYMASAIQDF